VAKARKLFHVLRHSDYRAALRIGKVAAAVEHERLLKTLRCATVVDIGANRGQFALVTRHCFPQARLICFEPLAEPARRFCDVFGGDPLVCLHRVAVGKESGEGTIHVAGRDGSSSLLPLTALQTSLFPRTSEVRTETVQIAPLEKLLTRDEVVAPALLKIDVQGYELNTLQGCETLLGEFDYVYVECSFVELYQGQALAHEVCAYLDQRGFRLAGVYNPHYDSAGRAIQADFLFANRSRTSQA
jgi:FkbM family methyltransferase